MITDYQTSEKIRVNYEIANVSLRLVAFMIDSAIQAIFTFIYIMLFTGFILNYIVRNYFTQTNGFTQIIIILIYIGGILLYISYHFIFELVWKGQTPGKRLMHIRVINDDGTSVSSIGVILRNLFRIVDLLPISYITGIICLGVNKQNKRIGDLIAGTMVVREQTGILTETVPLNSGLSYLVDKIEIIKENISETDKNIIEKYFALKKTLKPIEINRLSLLLISYFEKKLKIFKPASILNESHLSELYYLSEEDQ